MTKNNSEQKMKLYDVFMEFFDITTNSMRLSPSQSSDRALFHLLGMYEDEISDHMENCLIPVKGISLLDSYNGYFCSGFRKYDIIRLGDDGKFDLAIMCLLNSAGHAYTTALKYAIKWQENVNSGSDPQKVYDELVDDV